MILQALHKLAEVETLVGDPDFEFKPVSWVVILREDGTLVQIADNRRNARDGQIDKKGRPLKAKWEGRDVEVPRQPGRTSGDLAFFLVDKAEYALGVDPAGKRPPQQDLRVCGVRDGEPERILGGDPPRADLAEDLRDEIRVQMKAGKSDKEIIAFLTERYGQFILYRPQVTPTTYLLWFGPFVLLLAGLAVLFRYIKQRRDTIAEQPLSSDERRRAEELLQTGSGKETA